MEFRTLLPPATFPEHEMKLETTQDGMKYCMFVLMVMTSLFFSACGGSGGGSATTPPNSGKGIWTSCCHQGKRVAGYASPHDPVWTRSLAS